TGANLVRVGDPAVCRQEFRPTTPASQVLLRHFPERIAPLHAHGFMLGDGSGWQRALRLYRTNRCDGCDRLRRFGQNGRLQRLCGNCWLRGLDESAGRRGQGKNFWLRWSNKAGAGANCWAHTFVEVRARTRTNIRTNLFAAGDRNIGSHIYGSAGTNRNGREGIAPENIRRQSGMQSRLSRRSNLRRLRHYRRGERGSSDGEMEWLRLFRFQRLQLFLLAKLTSDFPERRLLML